MMTEVAISLENVTSRARLISSSAMLDPYMRYAEPEQIEVRLALLYGAYHVRTVLIHEFLQRCTIKSVAKQAGSITAQSRSNQTHFTGFGFVHCNIIGTGQIVLGRAWRPYARVVIASTHMDDIINSARWDDWGMSDVDE